ncbi:MAG: hypothetical protein KF865_10140 [Bdellovibrionaceae bacterium]|nr:hypothetical protein [Pseudobdellovibrionaceae bacterium]
MSWAALPDTTDYQIALDTSAGGNGLRDWTSIGSLTTTQLSGLALNNSFTYYVSVRAVDAAGNLGPVSSLSWIVDSAPPTTPSGVQVGINAGSLLFTPLLEWNASSDAGIGFQDYIVEIVDQLTATLFLTTTATGNSFTGPLSSSLPPRTPYFFRLSARDLLGNITSKVTSATWTSPGWLEVDVATAPSARNGHTMIWTGSRAIVWGGFDGTYLNSGSIYDPATNSWSPITLTGAPDARANHTAVWTGSEMLIWGGANATNFYGDLHAYNPATDTWTNRSSPLAGTAPNGRKLHTAVWANGEMIVWGGIKTSNIYANDGARYNPATETWTPVSAAGINPRANHTAVWTGSAMIVWGGVDSSMSYLNGSAYDPASNTWTGLTTTNSPSARANHTAVWTGSEMIVWGGVDSGSNKLSTGASYNPSSGDWHPLPTGAPAARTDHIAVWTGQEMVIFAGSGSSGNLNDGAKYHPATASWNSFIDEDAPTPRQKATAVWTGTDVLVWGGVGSGGYVNTGGLCIP